MFKINNYHDLALAYEILELAFERGKNEKAVELKREMRAFTNKPLSDRRFVQDYGMDGYVVLFPLPEYVKTMDEAKDYFEECEYIHYRPSAYDCTGQAFTSWYKLFVRNGRFHAYHSVAFDV